MKKADSTRAATIHTTRHQSFLDWLEYLVVQESENNLRMKHRNVVLYSAQLHYTVLHLFYNKKAEP